jgi:hypothetical protein
MYNLTEIANRLLEENMAFVVEYSFKKLELIKKQLENIERLILSVKNPAEIEKLVKAQASLHKSYAELLEHSTVVFMASVKPLDSLIEYRKELKAAKQEHTPIIGNKSKEPFKKLSLEEINNMYQPYQD